MKLRFLCLMAFALAAPGSGAGAAPGDSRPAVASLPAADYRFAPGDVIDITVISHPGQDRTLTVQPDGKIQVPFVGEIVAAGRTAVELARLIREGLGKELVDPQVTVSLRSSNPIPVRRVAVSVLGAVRSQGSYELPEKGTLADLLAASGGALPGADLARVVIARAPEGGPAGEAGSRSEVRTVDLSQKGQVGLAAADIPLRGGDLVIVPAGAPATVVITGEVAKPGSLPLQDGNRLLDLLSQAGGATARADLSRVRLTRGGETQTFDLRPLVTGEENVTAAANPALQAGDAVAIPENTQFIYLLGAVSKPDTYPVSEAGRVFDLLTRAGGPTPQADLAKAVLVRRDAQGQPQTQPLDLRRMLTKGDMKNNLTLQAGDVVVIPSKTPRGPSTLGTLGSILWPWTSIFSVFR